MEGINGSLRVLSRSSSSSGVTSSSSPSFPISLPSLHSPLLPYTSSSFAFPSSLPSHILPPTALLTPTFSFIPASSVSAPAFSSTSFSQSNTKISTLTSMPLCSPASPLPSVPSELTSSIPSTLPSHTPLPVETPYSITLQHGSSSKNNGVVVVGAIGKGEDDVSQLLNRILDAHVFGSNRKPNGRWEKGLSFGGSNKHMNNIFGPVFHSQPSDRRSPLFLDESLSKGTRLEDGLNDTIEFERGESSHCESSEDSGNSKMDKSRTPNKEKGKYDARSKVFENQKRTRFWKREEWIKDRLSHYFDEEKGIVYVQFTYGFIPKHCLEEEIPIEEGLQSLFEESESNTLWGLLYMFSVCHVILFVQNGVRVDTRVLPVFRILQNAKHVLAPFVKTQVLPGLLPSPVSDAGRGSTTKSSVHSTNNSPGRSGSRNVTKAPMPGSAPSLFPGQCTPVLLFVFLEEFSESSVSSAGPNSHHENILDVSSPSTSQGPLGSQLSGLTKTIKQTLHAKSSNPVVMLARSINRTEGGVRKKLQTSLEAQIRFLIKKCRILSGSGDIGPGMTSGMGPRGPGSGTGGSALFVLDTTRVAFLVDRGKNHKGEALEATISLIEDMFKGKELSGKALEDLVETPSEDIHGIKEFLWRQADILRGKGGTLINPTGGSAGVGMVAAAAAAAAASAAAGSSGGSIGIVKPLSNPPELPSLTCWLSACQILAEALAGAEVQTTDEAEKGMVLQLSQRNLRKGLPDSDKLSSQGTESLKMTFNYLESGMDLDTKFSASWCNRVFPTAVDVYLKGLPQCYPTAVHISHLEKAVRAFRTMVRGPAVHVYAEKLKEECESVWKSGRQRCDAVSLTGNPCIHQVHEVILHKNASVHDGEVNTPHKSGKIKAMLHSSGMVFLHACACGRSRRLRKDPFDYESANTSFFQFSNCESTLPSLRIPDTVENKPLGGSAWSLFRLGNAKYYQPAVGLLQSGFCGKQNFLSLWILAKFSGNSPERDSNIVNGSTQELAAHEWHSPGGDILPQNKLQASSHINHSASPKVKHAFQKQLKTVEKVQPDVAKSLAVKGALENKKAFANVVSWGNYDVDLAFPPLQQTQGQHTSTNIAKNGRQTWGKGKNLLQNLQSDQSIMNKPTLHKSEASLLGGNHKNSDAHKADRHEECSAPSCAALEESTPDNKTTDKVAEKEAISLRVGFEHECPHGHRFLISSELLDQLGSIFAQNEELMPSNTGNPLKQTMHDKAAYQSTESAYNSRIFVGALSSDKDNMQTKLHTESMVPTFRPRPIEMDFPASMWYKSVSEGTGEGYGLLNRNLPVYMNCPYCMKKSEQLKRNDVIFAGTISQLQRIFVVTPSFPFLVSACPVVQFSKACKPDVTKLSESVVDFSLGCNVLLPSDSFVCLRLPFVYFVEHDDGSRKPLMCNSKQPEHTAWLLTGSSLKVMPMNEKTKNVL